MNNEDKRLIADYMWWYEDSFFKGYRTLNGHAINFDSNDASLVVAEMQKRGEWDVFIEFADDYHFNREIFLEFSAWLMTMENGVAENFFKAFTEWRKGK